MAKVWFIWFSILSTRDCILESCLLGFSFFSFPRRSTNWPILLIMGVRKPTVASPSKCHRCHQKPPGAYKPNSRQQHYIKLYWALLTGFGEVACPTRPNRLRPRRATTGKYCLLWGWGLLCAHHTSITKAGCKTASGHNHSRRQQHYTSCVVFRRVFRVRELAGRSGSSSKTPPLNPPRR